jgi:Tfp pilus assembly protein PilE
MEVLEILEVFSKVYQKWQHYIKKEYINNSKSIILQQQSYKCYYYDEEFSTQEEHLRHSVNSHKGKPAQPEDKCLFELLEIQPKGNSWEKL